MIYGSGPVTARHAKTGRLRIIAITSGKRSRALPDVPTVAESGVPGYEAITWYGLMGPKGIPRPIVARWHEITKEALASPEMQQRFDADGVEMPEPGTAYFQQVLKREIDKWSKVIKTANIKLGK